MIAINWLYYMKYSSNPRNILKNNILLPTLYNDKYGPTSNEHIYPKCFLNKDHYHEFHNIFRASKSINNIRSNYMFSDKKNIIWEPINKDNYISHKHKLFNPRNIDKGIIARAILYMNYKYEYDLLVNKEMLYDWCLKYEPTIHEKLHNLNGFKVQGNYNPLISNFYDKNYICFLKNILEIYN
jgi:endonuclease I